MSDKLQHALFSKTSVVLHSIWFALWFLFGFDINTLTLIVSLEAIYITLFIGLGQQGHIERQAPLHKLINEIHERVHK